MDFEIDLGRYFSALAHRWFWIVLAAALGAALAIAGSFMTPSRYAATSAVLLSPTRSQVTLDPRFVTNEAIDATARRQALLALAKSPAIETQIPSQTLKTLVPAGYTVGRIASQITVKAEGDLLQVSSTASSPQQAQALANAWALALVDYLNALQGNTGTPTTGNAQIRTATERYTAAQQAYEQFLGSSRRDELQQKIGETLQVISDTAQADQSRYRAYLAHVEQLESVLRDANALRAEIAANPAVGSDEKLAVLLLRTRAAGGEQPPVQLQVGQSVAAGDDGSATLTNLDGFIKALQTQIVDMRAAATKAAADLTSDTGPPGSGLDSSQREANYGRLLELRRQLEAEEGKRQLLQQERDITLEGLQVVRRKIAEEQVATVRPDAEVRLAAKAPMPEQPLKRYTLLLAIAGSFAGAMLGVIAVLLAELSGLGSLKPADQVMMDRRINSPSSS